MKTPRTMVRTAYIVRWCEYQPPAAPRGTFQDQYDTRREAIERAAELRLAGVGAVVKVYRRRIESTFALIDPKPRHRRRCVEFLPYYGDSRYGLD